MTRTITLGDVEVHLTLKAVRHAHLSVHPPGGRVTLVAPLATRPEVARAYAATRLGWIRRRQSELRGQARETPRRFVTRESHDVWGRRHLLVVREADAKPAVRLDHRRIELVVRPGSTVDERRRVVHEWHKALLRPFAETSIRRWEPRLGVDVRALFLQRMKTKWGSCNPRRGYVRLNTELVRKPKDLVEYVVVHELVHLLEPTHSARFARLMTTHLPAWREARDELNGLPLSDQAWRE